MSIYRLSNVFLIILSLMVGNILSANNIAVELSGVDCLCAKLDPDGIVLVFRRHHQNKYHAYPIESSEYSKYGIKPDEIPSLAI